MPFQIFMHSKLSTPLLFMSSLMYNVLEYTDKKGKSQSQKANEVPEVIHSVLIDAPIGSYGKIY